MTLAEPQPQAEAEAERAALLVGGHWVDSGPAIEVRSPYDGSLVGEVAGGGAEQTRQAIEAAQSALSAPWPAHARAALLDAVAAGLTADAEAFAVTLCGEAGKPLTAARAEVARAASTFTFAAVEARTLAGVQVPMDAAAAGEGKLAFTLRRPVGVVGAITPFNFPLNLVAHKVAPALAAGCSVVLKPATQTPLSALRLARLLVAAGLPGGRLSVVVGPSAEIGDVLVADERVRALTFTGSAAVGWRLAERAVRKRVKLELGNAAPVVVAADADLELAAAKVAAGAFAFSGQSCISVQRVYVERSRYDAFVAELVPRVRALCCGDPADPATEVGPIIDAANRERILRAIAASGGRVLTGGDLTADGILRPTVIAEPDPDAQVMREEIFGPVCSVAPVDSLAEAYALANATDLGLQAAIFTADYRTALDAAEALDFGGVLVNEAPTFRSDQMPYGGVKNSGNTKEGPAWAVRELTEERLVVLAR